MSMMTVEKRGVRTTRLAPIVGAFVLWVVGSSASAQSLRPVPVDPIGYANDHVVEFLVDPQHRFLITQETHGTYAFNAWVRIVDLDTDATIAHLPLGPGRRGDLACTSDGSRLVVSVGRELLEPCRLVVIDLDDSQGTYLQVVDTIVLPGWGTEGARALAVPPGSSLAFVGDWHLDTVHVVDLDTSSVVAAIPTPFPPRDLEVGPFGQWVHCGTPGALVSIEVSTLAASSISIPELEELPGVVSNQPHIAVHPDGSRVFVSRGLTPIRDVDVDPMSPDFGTISERATFGYGPHRIATVSVGPAAALVQSDFGRILSADIEAGSFTLFGQTDVDPPVMSWDAEFQTVVDPTTGGTELLYFANTGSPGEVQRFELEPAEVEFIVSGDANDDTVIDISDSIFILAALFVPGAPAPDCVQAGDANRDGGFDISDVIHILSALFVPGSPQLEEGCSPPVFPVSESCASAACP